MLICNVKTLNQLYKKYGNISIKELLNIINNK